MKPELKARWLAKLRDPETKKTQGWLKDNKGQCCLGVLCEVMGLKEKVSYYGERLDCGTNDFYSYDYKGAAQLKSLPHDFFNEVGIHADSVPIALMTINDANETFKEVIDYIEREL